MVIVLSFISVTLFVCFIGFPFFAIQKLVFHNVVHLVSKAICRLFVVTVGNLILVLGCLSSCLIKVMKSLSSISQTGTGGR
jgi:hypothetical protein